MVAKAIRDALSDARKDQSRVTVHVTGGSFTGIVSEQWDDAVELRLEEGRRRVRVALDHVLAVTYE